MSVHVTGLVVEVSSHGFGQLAVEVSGDVTLEAASEFVVSFVSGGFHRSLQRFQDYGGMLSSNRRVKKGPGRRPQSAKRRRFMQLRERGWSVRAAAREVGTSRTSGANWARGYKVYRNGEAVGFVEPLHRLEVRKVSSRFLSQSERITIADLRLEGMSIRRIADKINRCPSTVSRELRRNCQRDGTYHPFNAQKMATLRRARPRLRRFQSNPAWADVVAELVAQRWSPQQVSRHLRAKYPADPQMRLCHESIYQGIYLPGSVLLRPAKVVSEHKSPLRTGRDHRKAHQRFTRRRVRFDQPVLSIHDRPFDPWM